MGHRLLQTAASGNRHRCVAARAGVFPAGAQQSHAAHSFDGDDEVHGTENRPPARASPVHPFKAGQPGLAQQSRPVSAKTPKLDLKTEQAQPIAQPQIPNQAVPGQKGLAKTQPAVNRGAALPQTPQAQWVKPANHHSALRHQHPLNFAQGCMGVWREV